MKNQACFKHSFQPPVFLILSRTNEKGIANSEIPSANHGDPMVNEDNQLSDEVINPEFYSAG